MCLVRQSPNCTWKQKQQRVKHRALRLGAACATARCSMPWKVVDGTQVRPPDSLCSSAGEPLEQENAVLRATTSALPLAELGKLSRQLHRALLQPAQMRPTPLCSNVLH